MFMRASRSVRQPDGDAVVPPILSCGSMTLSYMSQGKSHGIKPERLVKEFKGVGHRAPFGPA
jgi:hypothetical protein